MGLSSRRQKNRKLPEKLKLRMWLFPYLSIATILAIVSLLAAMLVMDSTRTQISLSLLAAIVIAGAFFLRRTFGRNASDDEEQLATAQTMAHENTPS